MLHMYMFKIFVSNNFLIITVYIFVSVQVFLNFCTWFIPENMYESQNVLKLSSRLICYMGVPVVFPSVLSGYKL